MKKIKSFNDIDIISSNGLNVKNEYGEVVKHLNFIMLQLIDIIHIIEKQKWTYEVE